MCRKASEIYKLDKINCGEAMIKAYNEEHGTNIPVAIGTGFGTGLGCGSACGAVLGASVLIGIETGRESGQEENLSKPLVNKLVTSVREKYGSEICKDLKSNKISCLEIIDYTYEEMKKLLNK